MNQLELFPIHILYIPLSLFHTQSQQEKPCAFPEFREMPLVQMTLHLDNNESLQPILQKQAILQEKQIIQQQILETNATTAQRHLDDSEETLNRALTETLDLKSSLKARVEQINKWNCANQWIRMIFYGN